MIIEGITSKRSKEEPSCYSLSHSSNAFLSGIVTPFMVTVITSNPQEVLHTKRCEEPLAFQTSDSFPHNNLNYFVIFHFTLQLNQTLTTRTVNQMLIKRGSFHITLLLCSVLP